MKREPRISIPILLIAAGELFLIFALALRGMHRFTGMYATGVIAAGCILAGIAEIIRKNRKKKS